MRERFERATFDSGGGGGLLPHREITQPKKEVPITAEGLFEDNRSLKARGRIEKWHENSAKGQLIQSDACGDSRQEIPDLERSVIIQTISTGGPKEEYRGLVNHRAIRAIVNVTHHAGDTVKPKTVPRGCGGLGAKEEMEKNGNDGNSEGIEHYVAEDIYHSDVIVQTCVSAMEIGRMTDKPVLASTQDHLTGEIHPLIAFWTTGNTSHSIHHRSIKLDDILRPDKYDPEKIYVNGLPCIDIADLPGVFQDYLEANRREIEKLHEDYPDYRERQRTQNPSTIVLSTDIRPIRLRYPESFDVPGSVFRLSMPRRKYVEGDDLTIEVPQQELQRVLNQAQYPIEHFTNARSIIIETRDYNLSVALVESLRKKPWMGAWAEKDGTQIIIIETQGGRVKRMAEFKAT